MSDKNSSAFCTFGLDKWLESLVDVTEAPFTIYDPVQRSTLLAWERRNNFNLPEDLRNFYLSNDGIDLKWYCNNQNDHVGGQIKVCPLMQIKAVKRENFENIICADSGQNLSLLTKADPSQDSSSSLELFIIGPADYNSGQILISKPVKVSTNTTSTSPAATKEATSPTTFKDTSPSADSAPANFYLLDNTLYLWKLPCENFSQYFRLAILHCGVRNWHYIFTDYGLPIMTSFLLKLVSPGRLNIYLKRQKFKIDQKLKNLSDKHGYLQNFDFDDLDEDEDGEEQIDSESCTTRISLDVKFIAS